MAIAMCSLFLARAWQAGLFNPGGFQTEFHALKFGRQVSLVCTVALAVAVVMGGSFWSAVAMAIVFVLFVQGLSVTHALVKQRDMSQGWLVGVYLLLLLPHTVLLLAALGLVDNFIKLRQT